MRSYLMIAVLALAATGCTFGKIEPGHVGVVVPLSGDDKGSLETASNGWYMYSFNTQVYEFPVYNQQYNWANKGEGKERLYFGDRNGLRLGADVGIQFHVPASQVTTLFKTYRQDLDHVRDTILKMSVQNALNRTAANYTAEDVFGDKRSEFFDKVYNSVKTELAPNGLDVVSIYLNGELELPEAIRTTIQAKLQATMSAQQKENEKRTVEAEAAKTVAAAEGAAKAQIATAEGQAKTDIAKAEGEAKAAIARATGEASARIAEAKGLAESRVLQATAEAQANSKLAGSLTGSILELRKLEIQAGIQKAYAEKWQGGVPTTILPAQAPGYMMDMRGMASPLK
jgi:regulator of protease activity HflC (stomatin/prohibitin superfamily)